MATIMMLKSESNNTTQHFSFSFVLSYFVMGLENGEEKVVATTTVVAAFFFSTLTLWSLLLPSLCPIFHYDSLS